MGNGGVNLVDIPCALDIYALEDEAASKFRSRRPPHPTLDLESVVRSQNWQTKVIFGIFGICQTDALLAFKHLNNNSNMKMCEFTESVVDSLLLFRMATTKKKEREIPSKGLFSFAHRQAQ